MIEHVKVLREWHAALEDLTVRAEVEAGAEGPNPDNAMAGVLGRRRLAALSAAITALEAPSHAVKCYCGETWQSIAGWQAQGLFTDEPNGDHKIHDLRECRIAELPQDGLYTDVRRCQVCGAVEGAPCVQRMHDNAGLLLSPEETR